MNRFHPNFQLNRISFSSRKELVTFSSTISDSLHILLKEWFSDEEVIRVKTSGSTGKPKNIELKKEYIINSANATGEFFQVKENTKALCCLPLEFIAGKMMVLRALTQGWHLDIIEPSSSPLLEVHQPYDFSAMVPLQLSNSLDKIHLIHKLIVGGGLVSDQLERSLKKTTTQVFATYGMTETITHIAVKPINIDALTPQKSCYQVLPNITIDIDYRSCLIIKAPEVSSEIIVTNDVVELISETEFIWKGRFDNMINSGGVKIYPEVLEKKLSSKINKRFFVSGTPDEKLGEKLILVVEGDKYPLKYEEVFSQLTRFETPKEIFFINRFVETETKKVQRQKTLDLLGF
ncbi:MAG: 2-succinylbenzoate--CoA ligase [Flavobacterium sp. SCGC AAA160-P02]|nr:MAG: 2-succinylbenzoate--CoA ligase [Flavobacterium sp. SCGC AAA160-P02]